MQVNNVGGDIAITDRPLSTVSHQKWWLPAVIVRLLMFCVTWAMHTERCPILLVCNVRFHHWYVFKRANFRPPHLICRRVCYSRRFMCVLQLFGHVYKRLTSSLATRLCGKIVRLSTLFYWRPCT